MLKKTSFNGPTPTTCKHQHTCGDFILQPNGNGSRRKYRLASYIYFYHTVIEKLEPISYEKILKREIALESPTFSGRMHVALIVVGFD